MPIFTKRFVIGGLLALVAAMPVHSKAGERLTRIVDFMELRVGMAVAQQKE